MLDLSGAPFLDADGAEAILAAASRRGRTDPVVFAGAASGVLDKLKAAGADLAAFPTVDEACSTPSPNGSRPRR